MVHSVKPLLVNLKSSAISEKYLFCGHFGEQKEKEAVSIFELYENKSTVGSKTQGWARSQQREETGARIE